MKSMTKKKIRLLPRKDYLVEEAVEALLLTVNELVDSHNESVEEKSYCEKNGHHYDGGVPPFGKREKSICITCCKEEPTTPKKTPEFCMESNCKKSDCQFHEEEMCCPECIGRISEPFPACHNKNCPCHQGESEKSEESCKRNDVY